MLDGEVWDQAQGAMDFSYWDSRTADSISYCAPTHTVRRPHGERPMASSSYQTAVQNSHSLGKLKIVSSCIVSFALSIMVRARGLEPPQGFPY